MTHAYRLSILALAIMFTLVNVDIGSADQTNSESPGTIFKKIASPSESLRSRPALEPKFRLAPKKVAPPIEEIIPTTRKAHRMKFSNTSKKLPKGFVKLGKSKIKIGRGTSVKKQSKTTAVFKANDKVITGTFDCSCAQTGASGCEIVHQGNSVICQKGTKSTCTNSCQLITTVDRIAPKAGRVGNSAGGVMAPR